jgi:hypothetical protein
MSKLAFIKKLPNGFVPVIDMSEPGVFDSMKLGEIIQIDFKRPRNIMRHRKFFALLNLAYEGWEIPESTYNGMPANKNFERFRKDIICQAGYYDVVANLKGEVRAEAKSISFGGMEEDEFNKLYNDVVNVILKHVLNNYTRDDLDSVIEQIVSF